MTNLDKRRSALFIFAFIILFANTAVVHSQLITRIAPNNITLRGVSIADYEHTMFVGDSATVLINADTINGSVSHLIQIPVPLSKNYTLYGVNYYDSLHAIVVGEAGNILVTTDKGKNWSQPQSGTNHALRAIAHITGSIFQIVGDGGTILRSIDSGVTWYNVQSGTIKALYAIAFGSPNVGFAAGESGMMIKTTDGGVTWNLQPQASDRNLNFYGIAMLDEHTATAVGDSALYRYTNDGTLWITKIDSNTIINLISRTSLPGAKNAPLRCIAYTGFPSVGTHASPIPAPATVVLGDGDIYYVLYNRFFTSLVKKKTDTTWTQYDTILSATSIGRGGDADGTNDGQIWRLNCIAIYNSGGRYLLQCGGQYGVSSYAVDTTLHQWIIQLNPIGPNVDNFLFSSFDSTGYGYCTETAGSVRKTSDNGFTWKYVFQTTSVSGVYCQDSNTAYIAGWNGGLWYTTNGGVQWDTIFNVKQNSLHGFAFPSPEKGFCVGDGGTVLRTFDAGKTWETDVTPFPSFFKSIAFCSADTGVAVGDNGSMMNTNDGGNNWLYNYNQPLSDPNGNLRYIQAFPDGTFYVSGDLGVMKSTDRGQNWEVIYQPPDSVGISFYNENIGIVGLYSTSTALVPDSMTLVYTTDGLKTLKKFTVPFQNVHRLIAHWLNDCSFLLFGIDGFIMKVNFCGINAVTEIISPASPPLKVYPNPSSQRNITVEYQTEKSGQVSIELWDETGKKISTLYSGFEMQGKHDRVLTLDPNLHGSFIIRESGGDKIQTLKVIKL